jgi:hypothetical protein
MASMCEPDPILKRDAGGRVFVAALRRIELVQEFERSGLRAAACAREF